ncbi:MAG: hypothetical protein D3909_06735 [Candidatus Electrothrix sp. ATG1]|nr:hypothetical protein [Candidatus Electrothrix sp. ATG1]
MIFFLVYIVVGAEGQKKLFRVELLYFSVVIFLLSCSVGYPGTARSASETGQLDEVALNFA